MHTLSSAVAADALIRSEARGMGHELREILFSEFIIRSGRRDCDRVQPAGAVFKSVRPRRISNPMTIRRLQDRQLTRAGQ
jgi:hypothetical protein